MSIRLSFSAAQRYLLSPMSYYLHYLARIRPIQLSSPLIFGAALDEGLNSLLIDKKEGLEPNLNKALNVFTLAFQYIEDNGKKLNLAYDFTSVKYSKADLDESLLTKWQKASGINQSWGSLLNKGLIMIQEYHEQALPQIQKVLAVQLEINLPNEQGDVLTGIVDFIAEIDGKRFIVDNKSTSVNYKADSADNSEQLHTYFEALRDEYNLDGIMYLTISKKIYKKKKPQVAIHFIPGTVSEEVMTKTFDNYEYVLQGIKNEQFDCSGMCRKTPWGCQYSGYCNTGDMSGLVVHEKRNK